MTATWDPNNKDSNVTLSNGDMTAAAIAGYLHRSVKATLGRTSGKYYFEVSFYCATASAYNFTAGVQNANEATSVYVGDTLSGWGYQSNGRYYNSAQTGGHPTWERLAATTFIIRFALDLDNAKIWYGLNGTWEGDPAAGTGAVFSNLSGTLYPACTPYVNDGSTFTLQAAASDFTYSAPAGFDAWDAPAGQQTALEDARLDLAAYYQGRADLATLLEAAYLLALEDLPLNLETWGWARADLSAPLQAAALGLGDVPLDLSALARRRQDIALALAAVSPEVLRSLGLSLAATDGTVQQDLALTLGAIQKAPAFRAVIAQRLASIKRGAV